MSEPRIGQDIALRDIARVVMPDGSRAVGRVIALSEVSGQAPRAVVDTPAGVWRGPARDVAVIRWDEVNRSWRDG
jgi:hypothetical protein